jgi:hypothetical protein
MFLHDAMGAEENSRAAKWLVQIVDGGIADGHWRTIEVAA